MVVIYIFLLCVCPAVKGQINDFPSLNVLKSRTPTSFQVAAVQQLIQRFVGHRASDFKVVIQSGLFDGKFEDTFSISSDGRILTIEATNGVSAARGFGYVLQDLFGGHISWAGDNIVVPPEGQFPVIKPGQIVISSPNRYRYYQNVCTPSYSFVWWNWTRWEREIDWMVLNGYNLPLAFNAQEAIWQKVYLKLGFSQEALDKHFAGPAFLAWQRMGNMHGWGGPLPSTWHTQQLALQHKILTRMRSFGMIPVLPGFAGHVPETILQVFPNASVSRLGDWGNFQQEYCCMYLLDPTDPLFQKIGSAFIQEQIEEYNGTDHIYNADTFNEMMPKSHESSYLSSASRGVYEGIVAADPDGIWLMQGWLFQDQSFWGHEEIKALLQGVPIGKMIVLDLFAEAAPIYSKTESFYGQPFIWCMLHNFGGNTGLYGKIHSVNKGPFIAMNFANTTMVGMGITPEGIEQNDMIYTFFNSLTYRTDSIDVSNWISVYAQRRYGGNSTAINAAWTILIQTVYNCIDAHGDHNNAVILRRPKWLLIDEFWYDWTKVGTAWELMLSSAMQFKNSSLFRYDLVDVTRQVLQDLSYQVYLNLSYAFERKDLAETSKLSSLITTIILDMDNITSSHDKWLLGTWLESAKALGTNDSEKKLYEYNARQQITLWGPNGEILDYANKQWGGLLRTYYFQRWSLFGKYLSDCLRNNHSYDQATFDKMCLDTEKAWTFDRSEFPTTTEGDTILISQDLFKKYNMYFIPSGARPKTNIALTEETSDAYLLKYGDRHVVV